MATQSTDFLLNSLKGKIWLAVTGLAVLNCIVGLIAYFITSYFLSGTFLPVFVPFMLVAFIMMVFGWWLSNEVLRPIEKVALLAKSLERSPIVSMPKTTGSSETDELLQTLVRNSKQLHNLMGMMDSVANGKTDIALTPLQDSDRLSLSFQKLVAKVTDSIDAKNELTELRSGIDSMKGELAAVRKGDLDVVINPGSPHTKDIADAVNFLSQNLKRVIERLTEHSENSRNSAGEAQRAIADALEQQEAYAKKINRLSSVFREYPNSVESVSEELGSIVAAIQAAAPNGPANQPYRENLNAVNGLRRQINEVTKRLRTLSEHSARIEQTARTAEDLARRSNLISLNISVQRSDVPGGTRGGSSVAEEVEYLSLRAASINKEISSINESLRSELESAMNLLSAAVAEVSEVSIRTIRDGDSFDETQRTFERIAALRTKIESCWSEQSVERENALQAFTASTAEAGRTAINLRECEANIENLNASLDDINEVLATFYRTRQENSGALGPQRPVNAIGAAANGLTGPPKVAAVDEPENILET